MKFGIHLPNFSAHGGREATIRIARRTEELGFDSLWVSDHVVLPARVDSRYPYSRTGAFPIDAEANFIDPFITLAVAAGCTERVALGITVLVLPLRNPLLTAKMLASPTCSPAAG
jgi:alkanesulfonate monooxygenase SsuD/methylene tetrahydromethanopterin reductase-like flavin-dependent oxidoreductase (luciferase family)